ncbi:unnamed protein product, partial [Didymodactylos carnosus]
IKDGASLTTNDFKQGVPESKKWYYVSVDVYQHWVDVSVVQEESKKELLVLNVARMQRVYLREVMDLRNILFGYDQQQQEKHFTGCVKEVNCEYGPMDRIELNEKNVKLNGNITVGCKSVLSRHTLCSHDSVNRD